MENRLTISNERCVYKRAVTIRNRINDVITQIPALDAWAGGFFVCVFAPTNAQRHCAPCLSAKRTTAHEYGSLPKVAKVCAISRYCISMAMRSTVHALFGRRQMYGNDNSQSNWLKLCFCEQVSELDI